ncbi:hypothetical protein CPB84DRAFT_1674008 [Gymnopilus junonius]|uniref:Small ribosomal subunit protein mS41 n=1 Tax=Gymnopilus junonius TaxID=109634 RepID=A0A9P5TSJ8_GYMJU|nr:hypothetical protein CPB84DRAFT_1674008 [Gymnopilus junonius]
MTTTLFNLQRGLVPRLSSAVSLVTRTLVNGHARPSTPPPRDPAAFQQGFGPHARPAENIRTTEDFLKAIGRSFETKLDPTTSWEDLWKFNGLALRKAGLAVRDRRYLLWCMSKYRLGFPIREFANELPSKKVIRGWGPKVQNGKRIRSRRIKDKTRK